ncbi:hypothetical protein H106_03350 [Trichophyton rubrum CBS 735.88]|nr:hypothetical protein H106_03350 [Trichophyton rubrum CBS 735.88]
MPQRVILAETNSNQRKKELSSYTRGLIYSLYKGGISYNKISTNLNIPKSIVATTIKKHSLQIDSQILPRPRRLKILSNRNIQSLMSRVRRKPLIIYKKLALDTFNIASRSILYRALKNKDIINHPAKKRPFLLPIYT